MKFDRRNSRRSGSIVVLSAVLMVLVFAMVGFAVDVGYLALVRTEAQSAADAGALAAAADLLSSRTLVPTATPSATMALATETAKNYVRLNPVGSTEAALSGDDIVFGRINFSGTGTTGPVDPATYNAMQVRVRRDVNANGEVPTFFARALGVNSAAISAQATAAFADSFTGFTIPPTGTGTLKVLPFAIDKQTWDQLTTNGTDVWRWDEGTERVLPGSDGIREVNLFPQGTGSPGNRGTIDIGNPNNSTADLRRQITDGVNADDLAYLGGKLELGADGTLPLGGDTGISAGMQNALESIRGQTAIIPIFAAVSGNGNNSTYTIVQFAGIRVMDVKLNGAMSEKRVLIQPAVVTITGGIPGGEGTQTTSYIYSPVWLVK